MKKSAKLLSIVLAGTMVLSMAACSSSSEETTQAAEETAQASEETAAAEAASEGESAGGIRGDLHHRYLPACTA